jgi:hypothetical protein
MSKLVLGVGAVAAFLLGVGSTLAFISFSRRERQAKYTCGCDPTEDSVGYSHNGQWKTTVAGTGGPIYIDAVPSETPDTVWVYPAAHYRHNDGITSSSAGGMNSNVTWTQMEFPGMEKDNGW